jgi:hypothetical protein
MTKTQSEIIKKIRVKELKTNLKIVNKGNEGVKISRFFSFRKSRKTHPSDKNEEKQSQKANPFVVLIFTMFTLKSWEKFCDTPELQDFGDSISQEEEEFSGSESKESESERQRIDSEISEESQGHNELWGKRRASFVSSEECPLSRDQNGSFKITENEEKPQKAFTPRLERWGSKRISRFEQIDMFLMEKTRDDQEKKKNSSRKDIEKGQFSTSLFEIKE